METPSPLSIKTQILCKRLSNTKFEPLLNEVPNGPGVVGQITRSKALVCAIEEWEVALLADYLGDLGPLVACRVYTSRIVSTGVEQDNRSIRRGLERGLKSLEIEPLCLGRKIRVGSEREANVREDLVVVRPSRA